MKHLVWLLVRKDRLPRRRWLRRLMLRSIFKPISDESRDYGAIDGFYDLGSDVSPEEAERFKQWAGEDRA